MPYTPNLNDFNSAVGTSNVYTPTLNDFNEAIQPTLMQSAGNDISSVVNPINLGLVHMGGNIIGDVGTGLNDIGATNAGSYLQNLGAQGANVTPSQLGIQNAGLGTSLASGIVQYSPYALAAPEMGASEAASAIPYAGRVLSPIAQKAAQAGALYGATQSSPGDAISGAVINSLANLGLTNLPAGLMKSPSAVKSLVGWVRGTGLQNTTDALYQNLSKNLAPTDLNAVNFGKIANNFSQIKSNLGTQYQQLGIDAANQGYDGVQKAITPSASTSTQLVNLANPQLPNSPLKNISPTLRGVISDYSSTPSFDNAHILQSMLGSESSGFSGGNADAADKTTAKALTSARNSLQSDISNSFSLNGNPELGTAYQNLGKLWKNNVIPYQKIPSVRNAINGGKIPDTVSILNGNDLSGNRNAIRSHITGSIVSDDMTSPQAVALQNSVSQTPSDPSTFLAQALNKGQNLQGGKYVTNPKILFQNYENMGSGMKSLMPQQTSDQLNLLSAKNLSRQK